MSELDSDSIFAFDDWRLIPAQRQLLDPDGKPATLRAKVFDLLLYLVQERGRVVEKTELMQALWPNAVVEENNLNQAISALRQVLGETAQAPRYVATVTGRGYQFVGDVRVLDARPAATPRQPGSSMPMRIALFASALAVVIALAFFWSRAGDAPESSGTPVIEQFSDLAPILVTDFPGSQTEPTLSPDGTMIAWISDLSGTPQIWVKNLQAGDPIQITDGPYAASSPTWTPDNSYIVYARKGPDGRGIFRVGSLGTPEPQRIIQWGLDPSFSLKSNAFVFSTGYDIYKSSGDGKEYRKIDAVPIGGGFASRSAALSPDGTQVAFIHADEGPLGNLWVAPVEGGEAHQLTSFTLEDGFVVDSPAWTPDGRNIVYSVGGRGGGSRLWQIAVDSGEAEPLTAGAGNPDQPIVSADGQRLVYTDTRPTWRITRVSLEDGKRSTLYETRNIAVLPLASPDRRELVFFSMLPSGAQVFTIDTDGRDLKQLTFDEPGMNTLPFWASDGRSIFYHRDRSLHRLFRDEGRDDKVLDDFHWSSRTWALAHGERLYFHEFDKAEGSQRAVILDLETGEEATLPIMLVAAEWSAAGDELLGFVRGDGIYICNVGALQCSPVVNAGEIVRGLRPKWSPDERQIYYLRHSEKGECCTLWGINRDGTDNRELVALPGYELKNSYFGVDHEGMIFYNHPDRSTAEIWLAAVE